MNTTTDEIFGAADVLVLGGGITGLSTAIVLQSLGLSVTIVAEKLPDAKIPGSKITGGMANDPILAGVKTIDPIFVNDMANNPILANAMAIDPKVATSYAMASAYPHNLRVKNLEQISDDSQTVFEHLCKEQNSGIELQELYEVFEDKPEDPPLASRRLKMEYFDGSPAQLKKTIDPPSRPGAKHLWGWKFDTYFADMPKYLSFLCSLFIARGGTLKIQKIGTDLLEHAAGRLFVNCLGVGAIAFTGDSAPVKILRGKQLLVANAPRLLGKRGLPVAYNYTPTVEIFPRGDGNPEYLHFFSRLDGWLLGQTREPGMLDQNGEWKGITSPVSTEDFGGVAIPTPMIELNRALLSTWLNAEFANQNLVAREGYRYYRDPLDTGVRLESEIKDNAVIVHNYGHGGSGITMSWGCALETARIVSQHLSKSAPRPDSAFDRILQNSVSCLR